MDIVGYIFDNCPDMSILGSKLVSAFTKGPIRPDQIRFKMSFFGFLYLVCTNEVIYSSKRASVACKPPFYADKNVLFFMLPYCFLVNRTADICCCLVSPEFGRL